MYGLYRGGVRVGVGKGFGRLEGRRTVYICAQGKLLERCQIG